MKYLDSNDDLNIAIEYIKSGKTVIFPTETVYGIGANALDRNAVDKIFKIKGRPQDNPLIVHISNIDMLKELVTEVNEIEKKLIDRFWPGPLTIIFPKNEIIPNNVTCNLDTVGIRMPSNEIARNFITKCECPIAAPSANKSGKPSGTFIDDILDEFMEEDVIVIDGGESEIGLESTVIKVTEGTIEILRPGYITYDELSKIAPTIMNKNVTEKPKQDEKVESPGMKFRHYAPNVKCVLVVGEKQDIEKKMLNEIQEKIEENKDIKIEVLYKYNLPNLKLEKENIKYICMGKDDEEISKKIYHLLRDIDKRKPDIVYIESVEKKGLGIAIYNRLIRACEYNII
ncbi:MAG: threonylcarbamoyl-AMP synthase [Clostridiales bacterium]|nr:threonylcarbamoyl-AMP synthase [Clostridiales bacterium]